MVKKGITQPTQLDKSESEVKNIVIFIGDNHTINYIHSVIVDVQKNLGYENNEVQRSGKGGRIVKIGNVTIISNSQDDIKNKEELGLLSLLKEQDVKDAMQALDASKTIGVIQDHGNYIGDIRGDRSEYIKDLKEILQTESINLVKDIFYYSCHGGSALKIPNKKKLDEFYKRRPKGTDEAVKILDKDFGERNISMMAGSKYTTLIEDNKRSFLELVKLFGIIP